MLHLNAMSDIRTSPLRLGHLARACVIESLKNSPWHYWHCCLQTRSDESLAANALDVTYDEPDGCNVTSVSRMPVLRKKKG